MTGTDQFGTALPAQRENQEAQPKPVEPSAARGVRRAGPNIVIFRYTVSKQRGAANFSTFVEQA